VAGCANLSGSPPPSESRRTQRPPQEVRASLPESISQTFDASVKAWSDSGIKIGISTTLTGATTDFEPGETTLKFNEDNTLQDKVIVESPSFGETMSVTLTGEIGRDETDVSLTSHTEFEPHGSLSLYYTKLLPADE